MQNVTEDNIVQIVQNILKQLCCFENLQVFADNAAAIAGGLKIGAFYRTGDTVKVVH